MVRDLPRAIESLYGLAWEINGDNKKYHKICYVKGRTLGRLGRLGGFEYVEIDMKIPSEII